MKRRTLIGLLLLLLPLPVFADHVLFEHNGDLLSGHYLKPTDNQPAKAVLLFVHGDGATSFDAEGFYDILWQPLRENGYAIFSWDKPGVGDSTGDWRTQSMADRQSEVLAAIYLMQSQYGFSAQNTGLLGFSQAGWVVPAIAATTPSKIGFFVGIGFASNWIAQGRYYTKVKHKLAGENEQQIQAAVDAYDREIQFLSANPSYDAYLDFAASNLAAGAMSPARFAFVLKNVQADASEDLKKAAVPGFLLWGEDDLNVDAKHEFAKWQSANYPRVEAKIIANASHAMLDSSRFSTQTLGFKQWLSLMWHQQAALAPTFMPTLLAWLNAQQDQN